MKLNLYQIPKADIVRLEAAEDLLVRSPGIIDPEVDIPVTDEGDF